MNYLRKTFTLPASSGSTTSDLNWDLAFLSQDQFREKYGLSYSEYRAIQEHEGSQTE